MQEVGRGLGKPKTEMSRRKVELGPSMVDVLRAHRKRQAEERLAIGHTWEDHDLVFCNIIGRPLAPNNVTRRHFQPAIKRASVPTIRFHDLRHTAATLMLLEGVPVKVVSERLGHSNVGVTLRLYACPAKHAEGCRGGDGSSAGIVTSHGVLDRWLPMRNPIQTHDSERVAYTVPSMRVAAIGTQRFWYAT